MLPVGAGSGRDSRREAPRASVPVQVHYRFDPAADFLAEAAVDLSVSGVFLRTRGEHPVGAMVHLRLELPDGRPTVEGFGRVARFGTCPDGCPGIAIQFVSLEERASDLLEELVGSRLEVPEPSRP
jgi:Tfp pilus assembly protein PilZ